MNNGTTFVTNNGIKNVLAQYEHDLTGRPIVVLVSSLLNEDGAQTHNTLRTADKSWTVNERLNTLLIGGNDSYAHAAMGQRSSEDTILNDDGTSDMGLSIGWMLFDIGDLSDDVLATLRVHQCIVGW